KQRKIADFKADVVLKTQAEKRRQERRQWLMKKKEEEAEQERLEAERKKKQESFMAEFVAWQHATAQAARDPEARAKSEPPAPIPKREPRRRPQADKGPLHRIPEVKEKPEEKIVRRASPHRQLDKIVVESHVAAIRDLEIDVSGKLERVASVTSTSTAASALTSVYGGLSLLSDVLAAPVSKGSALWHAAVPLVQNGVLRWKQGTGGDEEWGLDVVPAEQAKVVFESAHGTGFDSHKFTEQLEMFKALTTAVSVEVDVAWEELQSTQQADAEEEEEPADSTEAAPVMLDAAAVLDFHPRRRPPPDSRAAGAAATGGASGVVERVEAEAEAGLGVSGRESAAPTEGEPEYSLDGDQGGRRRALRGACSEAGADTETTPGGDDVAMKARGSQEWAEDAAEVGARAGGGDLDKARGQDDSDGAGRAGVSAESWERNGVGTPGSGAGTPAGMLGEERGATSCGPEAPAVRGGRQRPVPQAGRSSRDGDKRSGAEASALAEGDRTPRLSAAASESSSGRPRGRSTVRKARRSRASPTPTVKADEAGRDSAKTEEPAYVPMFEKRAPARPRRIGGDARSQSEPPPKAREALGGAVPAVKKGGGAGDKEGQSDGVQAAASRGELSPALAGATTALQGAGSGAELARPETGSSAELARDGEGSSAELARDGEGSSAELAREGEGSSAELAREGEGSGAELAREGKGLTAPLAREGKGLALSWLGEGSGAELACEGREKSSDEASSAVQAVGGLRQASSGHELASEPQNSQWVTPQTAQTEVARARAEAARARAEVALQLSAIAAMEVTSMSQAEHARREAISALASLQDMFTMAQAGAAGSAHGMAFLGVPGALIATVPSSSQSSTGGAHQLPRGSRRLPGAAHGPAAEATAGIAPEVYAAAMPLLEMGLLRMQPAAGVVPGAAAGAVVFSVVDVNELHQVWSLEPEGDFSLRKFREKLRTVCQFSNVVMSRLEEHEQSPGEAGSPPVVQGEAGSPPVVQGEASSPPVVQGAAPEEARPEAGVGASRTSESLAPQRAERGDGMLLKMPLRRVDIPVLQRLEMARLELPEALQPPPSYRMDPGMIGALESPGGALPEPLPDPYAAARWKEGLAFDLMLDADESGKEESEATSTHHPRAGPPPRKPKNLWGPAKQRVNAEVREYRVMKKMDGLVEEASHEAPKFPRAPQSTPRIDNSLQGMKLWNRWYSKHLLTEGDMRYVCNKVNLVKEHPYLREMHRWAPNPHERPGNEEKMPSLELSQKESVPGFERLMTRVTNSNLKLKDRLVKARNNGVQTLKSAAKTTLSLLKLTSNWGMKNSSQGTP
ncbi:hypothetical protein CYMTET_24126, partial [Cymbomonas tetramitiformis]